MDTSKLNEQRLTRECALCGFTTQDAIVVCPDDGSALVTLHPDPYIGTTVVGRFDIISLIGSGGMGNVYKANQRIVERTVAVKILHSEKLTKRDAMLRFQQEARAAGSLSHRNIVGLLDYGLTQENIPFIVMDYVEGISLFDVIKQSTLPVNRFIQIFCQLCDALDHAHNKGIIHRDIKPSNIMLARTEGGADLVKILDFGIAKLLPGNDSGVRMSLTQTGELFGSPQYMSPEQFAGQTLDARSDMYSLGCVMYEALTGKAPITGDSIIELVHKHTDETPAPFRAIKPDIDVPRQLEAVVFTALEKDPNQRFPSMAALKHNLQFVEKFAEDERTEPLEEPGVKKTRSVLKFPGKRLSRGTKLAIGIAAGLVTVVAGSIAILILAVNPAGDLSLTDAINRFRLDFTRTLEPYNEQRVLELTEQLRDSYARQGIGSQAMLLADRAVDYSNNIHLQGWPAINQLLRRAQIEEQFHSARAKDSYKHVLDALRVMAQKNRSAQKWQDNLSSEHPINTTIMDLNAKLAGKTNSLSRIDQLDSAEDLRRAGNIEQAQPLYESLLRVADQMTPAEKSRLADGLKDVGDSQASRGKDQAEGSYKSAIELKAKADGQQTEAVAQIDRALGLYYKNHGMVTKAESTLMDALAIAQAAGGEHSELVITLYNDLGEVYRAEKEFDKATEMFKLAEKLKQAP